MAAPFDRVWTRQPQVVVGINQAHSLSRTILALEYANLSFSRNTVEPVISSGGTQSYQAGSAGIGLAFTSSSQRYSGVAAIENILAADPFTIEVLCTVTAAPALAGFFSVGNQATHGCVRGLIAYGGGSNKGIYFWGSSSDLSSGVDFLEDGSVQHIFITSNGAGTPMKFFRNGVQIAGGTTPSLSNIIASSGPWKFTSGDTNAGWNSTPTAKLFKRAYYKKEFSANDIRSHTYNPWQLFAPLRRPIFSGFAAGGTPPDIYPLPYDTLLAAQLSTQLAM